MAGNGSSRTAEISWFHLDSIWNIWGIAKSVDCKVLILLIDDFNQKDPDILVRVVRALEKFVAPKILLVISALGDAWRKAVAGVNKSAEQKIQIFGDPIIVTPPSAEQILELFTKLHSLIVVSTNGVTICPLISVRIFRKTKLNFMPILTVISGHILTMISGQHA